MLSRPGEPVGPLCRRVLGAFRRIAPLAGESEVVDDVPSASVEKLLVVNAAERFVAVEVAGPSRSANTSMTTDRHWH